MSTTLNEDKITEIVIDFNEIRTQGINESWLSMFGTWTKFLLKGIFGNVALPVRVVGRQSEVESFARALGREKNHLSAISKYGLNDRRTYASKGALDSAVQQFEQETGINWPFK